MASNSNASKRFIPPGPGYVVITGSHATASVSGPSQPLNTASPVPKEATWASKVKPSVDKSLKRLTPKSMSTSGIPRVKIPEAVFQKGAELHKNFIICRFFGRTPHHSLIQSVLNYMWGKGRHLEIHSGLASNSVLVRIQNDFIRTKVLEKRIWYVDTTMFHVAQWSEDLAEETPSLDCIPLWAHLHGVPFNLIHQEGLSHIAGEIGEPKETDDWTVNLSSISSAHVKVEVNTTKALPTMLEVERENGSICTVRVDYPWLPPTCSHCKEVGHIIKNCLQIPPPTTAPVSAGLNHQKHTSSTPSPLCYNCKETGHLMRNCPKPPQQWTPVVGKQKRKIIDLPSTSEIPSVATPLTAVVPAVVTPGTPAVVAPGTPEVVVLNVTSPKAIIPEATTEPVTNTENEKEMGSDPSLVVNMDVETSQVSTIAPVVAVIPEQGDLTVSPPSPGSPMEGVSDCVLGLPAECPSIPVVVHTSSLVPITSTLDLNQNLFNPFTNSSHQSIPSKIPNLTLNSPQTKVSSYLEITKKSFPNHLC